MHIRASGASGTSGRGHALGTHALDLSVHIRASGASGTALRAAGTSAHLLHLLHPAVAGLTANPTRLRILKMGTLHSCWGDGALSDAAPLSLQARHVGSRRSKGECPAGPATWQASPGHLLGTLYLVRGCDLVPGSSGPAVMVRGSGPGQPVASWRKNFLAILCRPHR